GRPLLVASFADLAVEEAEEGFPQTAHAGGRMRADGVRDGVHSDSRAMPSRRWTRRAASIFPSVAEVAALSRGTPRHQRTQASVTSITPPAIQPSVILRDPQRDSLCAGPRRVNAPYDLRQKIHPACMPIAKKIV